MKKIIIYATVLLCLASCNNYRLKNITALANDTKTAMPAALITPADESWTISTAATVSASADAIQLSKATFETDGSYTFFYSDNKNGQKASTTFFRIQGKAVCRVNEYGKNVITLQPVKGFRISSNKEIPLAINELKEKFTAAYLWEKINFKNMPAEGFLLLVDISKHPAAASVKPGSIDKAWVTKFYSRK